MKILSDKEYRELKREKFKKEELDKSFEEFMQSKREILSDLETCERRIKELEEQLKIAEINNDYWHDKYHDFKRLLKRLGDL